MRLTLQFGRIFVCFASTYSYCTVSIADTVLLQGAHHYGGEIQERQYTCLEVDSPCYDLDLLAVAS